jgi:hypothetical protein
MKLKRFVLAIAVLLLSLSLMACPEVVNMPPQIVQINEDGEIIKINEIVYEHVEKTDFDPEFMLQSLINDQNIKGIDYIQSGISIAKEKKYNDISDQIIIETFLDRWEIGDDANFDGVVDELDDEYEGEIKTDEEGNYVYDAGKIFLASKVFSAGGDDMDFILKLTDEDGEQTQIHGRIVFVLPPEN